MSDREFSTNDLAERLLGRRPTDVVAIDLPCERGYWCPVCQVEPRQGEGFDERLHWSEYNGFLWCEVCNRDYPSALCVRLDGEREREWEFAGPEDAIAIFLRTLNDAIELHTPPADPEEQ